VTADRLAPAAIRDRPLAFGAVMLCFEHAGEIDAGTCGRDAAGSRQ
jgi:hypothetical protein